MGETFGPDKKFVESLDYLSVRVHENARRAGFWEADRNDGEMICLMHSELSEALEAIRHGNPPDGKVPEFSSLEVEVADCVIRILDFARARGLRLGEAILAKHAYNQTRPYRHGKKF